MLDTGRTFWVNFNTHLMQFSPFQFWKECNLAKQVPIFEIIDRLKPITFNESHWNSAGMFLNLKCATVSRQSVEVLYITNRFASLMNSLTQEWTSDSYFQLWVWRKTKFTLSIHFWNSLHEIKHNEELIRCMKRIQSRNLLSKNIFRMN